MSTVLEKPVLLDETGQAIVDKLEDIKDMIGTTGEFIPVQIIVTTPPTKTTYSAGETLDLSGIVVKLEGTNGASFDVTAQCTFSPDNGDVLTSSDTSVLISYHWYKDNIDFSTRQPIKIKTLSSITVTSAPTKTQYYAGETLDLTGLVVVATYDDTSTYIVTDQCSFSPDDGDTLSSSDTAITISYTAGVTTKTTSQAISVKGLSSIAVTTPPTTTQYISGDVLDLTGLVVTATFDDTSSAVVTNQCSFSPVDGTVLSTSDTEITISCTMGAITKTATQSISVIGIYGAEWDGTASSAWTRSDDAADFIDPVPQVWVSAEDHTDGSSPFDTISPWKDLTIVNDATAGELVQIPKYYYKWTRDGSKMKLQISMIPLEGFLVSPAHADRGDGQGERDIVYVGRFHCNNSNYKSLNQSYQYNKTRAQFRTSIHNLGTDIWQWDFAMYWTIMMLYLVEFADWNTQDKVGYGCTNERSTSSINYSQTKVSQLTYHTGIAKYNATDTYGFVAYRNITGLWSQCYDFVDGIYFDNQNHNAGNYPYPQIYCVKDPSKFRDSYMNDGAATYVGDRAISSSDLNQGITAFTTPNVSGFEYALYPSNAGGDYLTYICDNVYTPRYAGQVLLVGGGVQQARDYGGFYFNGYQNGSDYDLGWGSRLMKLPANS